VANYQLVIDASDNYYTRYLVNDACVQLNKPNVYASINQFAGQCTVFYPNQKGPCYRCLFPQPESAELANCAEAGVLGVLPGLLGTLQATEAIKWVLDIGQTLISRLLTVDALTMEWREFQLTSDPQCPLCVAKMGFAQLPRGPLPACPSRIQEPVPQISVTQLKQQLAKGPVNLLDVRQEEEHGLANMGGQVIPLNTLADRWSTLDPSRPLVVYCQSGQRSQAAVRLLIEQGFTEVSSLAGGLTAWFAEPGQAKVS
jgi:adenylyltransferase/sulfurtransferase